MGIFHFKDACAIYLTSFCHSQATFGAQLWAKSRTHSCFHIPFVFLPQPGPKMQDTLRPSCGRIAEFTREAEVRGRVGSFSLLAHFISKSCTAGPHFSLFEAPKCVAFQYVTPETIGPDRTRCCRPSFWPSSLPFGHLPPGLASRVMGLRPMTRPQAKVQLALRNEE